MEVACEIIKNNCDVYDKSNIEINKFKNLHLSDKTRKMNSYKFLNMIKSKKYMKVSNNFLKNFLDYTDDDIGFSLLTAYYIYAYGNSIFDDPDEISNIKLISSASQIVEYIEAGLNNNLQDKNKLCNYIDYYYSLYKIWKSQDYILEIDSLMRTINQNIKIYKLMQNKEMKNVDQIINDINDDIDKMFNINYKMCIKKLLDCYELISVIEEIKVHMWQKINKCYNKNRDTTIIIMIAELKSKVISTAALVMLRKNIYYNIDIEELIKKIQNNNFKPKHLNNIFNIFASSLECSEVINNINNSDTWSNEYDDTILSNFQCLFDEIVTITKQ